MKPKKTTIPMSFHIQKTAIAALCATFVANFPMPATAQWGASPAFENSCRTRLGATQIRVRVAPSNMVYRYDESVSQLTRRAQTGRNSQFTLGVTDAGFYSKASIGGVTLEDKTAGLACTRPMIDIEIGVGPQKISIGREFPSGTCSHNEIMEHELSHARANQQVAESIGPRMQQGLNDAYGQQIFYGTKQQLQGMIQSNIESQWLSWAQAEFHAVDALHEKIDNTAEYARMSTMCNGEASRILRGQH